MRHIEIGNHDVGGASARLTKPFDTGTEAREFLKAVLKAQEVPVKLYQMVVLRNEVRYHLSTTSKDVFLKLGSIGAIGQDAFVRLVNEQASGIGGLLITFPHEDGCKGLLCVIRLFNGNQAEIVVTEAFDK